MKRCPTCDKTFDDNMRFCQADGTPLVEDAPIDPYKTMVARPEDIAAASAGAAADDVLDLPSESDPAKTMFASEEEIRAEMAAQDSRDEDVIDIPPLNEPEPPRFSDPPPPPSPFSSPESSGTSGAPIPSPFDAPKPSTYEPSTPSFVEPEAEPVRDEPAFNPFDQPAPMAQAEWAPPPAPEPSWGDQAIGQNTPFQPPPAGPDGANKTLAIVSLIFGCVSICCYISPLTGLVALITGYMAIKNINNDPNTFGGKGLAIAGMITGGIFFLLGVFYWIYIIFIIGLSAVGSMGGLG